MSHKVISVRPEVKDRMDQQIKIIEDRQGVKYSYTQLIQVLLKNYEYMNDGAVVKPEQQLELELEDRPDPSSWYKQTS
tara:strand:+ start:559 stop:792 length:234 start_codon:yes stop_codon:yes gene_type:complete